MTGPIPFFRPLRAVVLWCRAQYDYLASIDWTLVLGMGIGALAVLGGLALAMFGWG